MALFTVLLPVLTVLSVLAIVIGTALSVRPTTTSAALLARVRSHGAATAVTALLLGSISGFAGLAAEARPEGPEWTWDAGEWHGVPVFLDAVWLALALALLPAILVAAVTVGAQRSVPAPQGRVRRAVLTPRTAASLVPRGPALPGVGIGLALGATLVLLWAEPSVPRLFPPDGAQEPEGYTPLAAGAQLAPWILGALVADLGAAAIGLRAIAHRPPIIGLTAAQDRAARTVAAHRLVRTVAWMLWLLTLGAWGSVLLSRTQRDLLHAVFPGHPAALDARPGLGWIGTVDAWTGLATLAVALVLLLWRPPALGELRTGPGIDRARTAETVRTETA